MKSNSSGIRHRPFQQLRKLLEQKQLSLRSETENQAPRRQRPLGPEQERQLFRKAMEGVAPLEQNKHGKRNTLKTGAPAPETPIDRDALTQLRCLIQTGRGFVVSDTAEYREGVAPNVHPSVSRHLHRGRFSIQAHTDLHGLTAAESREVLDRFFREAISSGKRGLLVVHGRGLSSPGNPVLKTMVHEWLTSGPWRKWVIAFSSARTCDGGAGATYVLLRRRPSTRRHRKQRRSVPPK